MIAGLGSGLGSGEGVILLTELVIGHSISGSATASATNSHFSEGTKWEFGG